MRAEPKQLAVVPEVHINLEEAIHVDRAGRTRGPFIESGGPAIAHTITTPGRQARIDYPTTSGPSCSEGVYPELAHVGWEQAKVVGNGSRVLGQIESATQSGIIGDEVRPTSTKRR